MKRWKGVTYCAILDVAASPRDHPMTAHLRGLQTRLSLLRAVVALALGASSPFARRRIKASVSLDGVHMVANVC